MIQNRDEDGLNQVSENYGIIAVIQFGSSKIKKYLKLTPNDILLCIEDQNDTERVMPKILNLKRRLTIVVADANETFASANLIAFLEQLSDEPICIAPYNTSDTSILVNILQRMYTVFEIKDNLQEFYDIVSYKNQYLDHLEQNNIFYQVESKTFFRQKGKCYIYKEEHVSSMIAKAKDKWFIQNRIKGAKQIWLKVPPFKSLETVKS